MRFSSLHLKNDRLNRRIDLCFQGLRRINFIHYHYCSYWRFLKRRETGASATSYGARAIEFKRDFERRKFVICRLLFFLRSDTYFLCDEEEKCVETFDFQFETLFLSNNHIIDDPLFGRHKRISMVLDYRAQSDLIPVSSLLVLLQRISISLNFRIRILWNNCKKNLKAPKTIKSMSWKRLIELYRLTDQRPQLEDIMFQVPRI